MIVIVFASFCFVYYGITYKDAGLMQHVPRPETMPPSLAPPLSRSPYLKALTPVSVDTYLAPNFYVSHIDYSHTDDNLSPKNDGIILMDYFGNNALDAVFQDIQILDNIILTRDFDDSYSIYEIDVLELKLLANDIKLAYATLLSKNLIQSSTGSNKEFYTVESVINGDYTPITVDGYKIIDYVGQDMLKISDNQLKQGIADIDGNIVFEPQFDWILYNFDGGYALAYVIDTDGIKYYAIDVDKNTYELPTKTGYELYNINNGIVWYKNFGDQFMLYDINRTYITTESGIITLPSSIVPLYDRAYGQYILISDTATNNIQNGTNNSTKISDDTDSSDDKSFVTLYNYVNQTYEILDDIIPIELSSKTWFIFKQYDLYYLLDSDLNIIVDEMDDIRYDKNIVLSKGEQSQVFSIDI